MGLTTKTKGLGTSERFDCYFSCISGESPKGSGKQGGGSIDTDDAEKEVRS